MLIQLSPHVSVLSTRCLPSHCSYCQSERTTEDSLKRCTLCKAIWYDTQVRRTVISSVIYTLMTLLQGCQNADWPIHKYECSALRQWGEKAREAGVGAQKDTVIVPSDAIRALGRILWNLEKLGDKSTWVSFELRTSGSFT